MGNMLAIKKGILNALGLTVFSIMSLYAQNTVAMPFVVRPVDASCAGLAGVDFADNTLFNSETLDVSAGYMLWSPSYDSTNSFNVSASYCLNERFSFSVDGVYGLGQDYGNHTCTQMLAGLGAGYLITDFLSVDVNLKYMSENLTPEASYNAFGADVYATGMFRVTEEGMIAAVLGVYSLGTPVRSSSGVNFSLPFSVRLGAGYIHNIGNASEIKVLAETDYYFNRTFSAAFGAEMMIADMIQVRAGYRYGAKYVLPSFASVGIGVHLAGFKIDAAYLFGSEVLANSMCVSLGYSF